MRRLWRAFPTRDVLQVLAFLLAWAFLNTVFNLRSPARVEEPHPWYLLPSVDVVALLAIFAALGWRRRYLPLGALIGLTVLAFAVRLVRISDGLIQFNYYRRLNLLIDAPMLPELARLLHSTVPMPRFIFWSIVCLLGLGVFLLLLLLAFMQAQRFLGGPAWRRSFFVGVTALLVGLAPLWPRGNPDPEINIHDVFHRGLFGTSILDELTQQSQMMRSAQNMRAIKATEIQNKQHRLAGLRGGLEHLRGADVLFLLVESYGSTVFKKPELFSRIQGTFTGMAAALEKDGYLISSSWLDSTTYGGSSWLAHGTLASGVRIEDGLHYQVLRQTKHLPLTMASVFQRRGYRTVLVQPGTTRPFPEGEVRGFTAKYYAPALEYQGPRFGWATMPDQYVLDRIHKVEIAPAKQPLFIQYCLVSSHAPWAVQPPLVDDWTDLGHGRIYQGVEPFYYPITWTNLHEAGDAYMDSLNYDFEVFKRYITGFVKRNSLIILLGDHQPAGVPGDDGSRTVPIHVITKDAALMARFTEAGYTPGFIPPATGAEVLGMEKFLDHLVERLSDDGQPAPTGQPSAR